MMADTDLTCQIHKKVFSWLLSDEMQCANASLSGDPHGFCILHSLNKEKDPEAFKEALLAIWNDERSEKCDFRAVFFPGPFNPSDVFGSREFQKSVDFTGATFGAKTDFSKFSFRGKAYFFKTTFEGEAYFPGARFEEVADFRARFKGTAYFRYATFAEDAFYFGANFEGEADFSSAIFEKEADFSGASFPETERVRFLSASFKGKSDFSRARFIGKTEFFRANFAGETYFHETSFTEEAYFSEASIGGRVVFRRINRKDEERRHKEGRKPLHFEGNFSSLQFQEKGVLRFQDMRLSRVRFAGTDLRRPEFHHVKWHCLRDGRQVLHDERLLRQREPSFAKRIFIFAGLVSAPEQPPPTSDNYGEVERLYRYLQVNYESVNDYKSSGDFHYGELEMHRRASPWRWFPFYWYNLYWFTSGYGERPLRSLLALWGFFLAFAGLFFWLEPSLPGGQTWRGLGNAILYVFQKGTLQRPDPTWLEQATGLSKFLAAIIPVLIPGQVALFFLALRNRMGRRR